MRLHLQSCLTLIFLAAVSACSTNEETVSEAKDALLNISGIYPHLAYYNEEGECGTGAVVPWADRLWVITYGPHFPYGSSDKLYEITEDLEMIVRPESIGGTPANRMIHNESNQLFIGPYAIDAKRNVRVIPWEQMPGRHTGNARHLTDPSGKIYYGTMEEGFYEVDVNTLEVNTLYVDGNVTRPPGEPLDSKLLLGAHGKGLYSGQGVLVYSNNGEDSKQAREKFDVESGALYEWDGNEWILVRRSQFVEVTGPGGIHGNENPDTDPIWATGWDHKSVLLAVRDAETGWEFFRLPKASHSYDGAHGWNTEWPRIRDVGTDQKPDYLMTMHGMFWKFPGNFTASNSAGIRPHSAYLKVIGDYTRWNNQLVFGGDDSAHREFLNKRKAKGKIEGPGQSNSNLWFTDLNTPEKLGPNTANGSVWLSENVSAKNPSEPFLFAGWEQRSVWIKNEGSEKVTYLFETDNSGNGKWTELIRFEVAPGASVHHSFKSSDLGEWIRVAVDKATRATVHFAYTDLSRFQKETDSMFSGLAQIQSPEVKAGLLYGLGDNRRALGMLAGTVVNGKFEEAGYYEVDAAMNIVKKDDDVISSYIRDQYAIPDQVIEIDEASVLVIDDRGRRWRLPLGNEGYTGATQKALTRICREVATERDLFSAHGTFYELPAENADGYAKIRPVASHNFHIFDYASYRGLLVMTGISPDATNNPHIFKSEDGKASVWAGVIDDLWKLGKPTGRGGPWKNSEIRAGVPSDPYLIGFYDNRSLSLSHQSDQSVQFTIEIEPIGHGPWMKWKEIEVAPGETFNYEFEKGFQARWVRIVSNRDGKATAWFTYH
ncbi:hypothetical protein ADIS_4798 [Lunatimonas lonarensis]|uniref:Uncharacterized protein n=1 Tax=Lunatimonas lonarensis TaxID=1232681 RepID=R7ZKT0_9BACT|nr:hypothetical protein [Lunatimonas lonarensis]EON74687.1 hypothetical protein ADIS_4798 [Lunatimonas lonarensis]